MLLLVIERVAALPRVRALTFYSSADTLVGRVNLDGGLVGIGAQVEGRVHIDDTFARDAAPVTAMLRKRLLGDPLSVPEHLQLHNIPLIARRALCGVTARALREIAQRCDLAKIRLVEGDELPARGSEERYSFSVVELLLAAGRVETMRYADAAARLYETPPGSPDERWLFEWQPDLASGPWPIMTTRMAERRTNTVAQLGILAQALARPLAREHREGRCAAPKAAISTTDLHAYYTVVTDHYVALLVYPLAQLEKLIKSLEDFAFSANRGSSPNATSTPPPIAKYATAPNRHKTVSLPPAIPRSAPIRHPPADSAAPGSGGDQATVRPVSPGAENPLPPSPPALAPAPQSTTAAAPSEPAQPAPIPTPVPPATAVIATPPTALPPPPAAEPVTAPSLAEEARAWLTAADAVPPAEPPAGPSMPAASIAALATASSPWLVSVPLAASESATATSSSEEVTPPPSPAATGQPSLSLVAAVALPEPAVAAGDSDAKEALPAPATALLDLTDFSVSVNDQVIIRPVSLQVAARGLHVWVVDGGVQRRLLLRVLCGGPYTNLTVAGRTLFDGHDLLDPSLGTPHLPLRNARALMQTAREYLLDGLPPSKGQRPGSRLPLLLQRIEHAGFADLVPHLDLRQCELDPFERRVVEVLRGVCSGARLLVQDDPLHGLEPRHRERLLQLLRIESDRRAILILASNPQPYLDLANPGRLQISHLDITDQPVVLPGQTGTFEAVQPVQVAAQRRSQASG